MTENSHTQHHWVQEDENWRKIPNCVGAIYDEDPELDGWMLISAPDTPKFNLLKSRVYTTTPPVKKTVVDSAPSVPTLTTYNSIDDVPATTYELSTDYIQLAAAATTAPTLSAQKIISRTAPSNDTPALKKPKLDLMDTSRISNKDFKQLVATFANPANSPTNRQGSSSTSSQTKRRLPNISRITSSPSNTGQVSANAGEQYKALSEEQKYVHDLATNKEGKNIFFTGSAGTGKSVVLRAIIATLKSRYNSDQIYVTASTGIAAVNIGGVTIHKYACIQHGDDPAEHYIKKISEKKSNLTKILYTKYLIIDEISMISGDLLDKLDAVFRGVRKSQEPFGGIKVIMTGDFFQLPPVSKTKHCKFAFQANCWARLVEKTMILKQTFRQRDQEFINILNALRVGYVTDQIVVKLSKLSRPLQLVDGIQPTELYPMKDQVDRSNRMYLEQLPGEKLTYSAIDRGDLKMCKNFMAVETLELKVNAQVMLIKNLTDTLVNGSIGIVLSFEDTKDYRNKETRYPKVRFANGEQRVLGPEDWSVDDRGRITSRIQIPLLLAWALSIHKSQGQTIDFVKVDLKRTFEKGQAYVALSRARCIDQLQVEHFSAKSVMIDTSVKEFYAKLERA